ncbi:type I secretion system permease/ATPase [Azotosporobacter soli]|uniref:peptidase domain-containing ABC transporter n=1 Tax=Azotosporobacter soli TaxID=3055040 RepID=UPI0031FE6F8B
MEPTDKEKQSEQLHTAALSLGVIAKTLGIGIADEQILEWLKSSAGEVISTRIIFTAKRLKLKTKRYKLTNAETLQKIAVPAIAEMKDQQYLVIGRNDGKTIMIFDPKEKRGQAMPVFDFVQNCSGIVITLQKPFSLKELGRRFNLEWFWPVLVRYKKIFVEIILASFFLQIFALATPLFTQVIIDKVLGQKGISTLDVLGIVFLIAAVFQCVMGILRTYLSSHTTNKIDMILGARLFRHLTALPLRYFELRRVGDTLTRVAALNGIREFLTGSVLTGALDAFFSLVFVLIMWFYSPGMTLLALLAVPLYIVQNVYATPLYRERLEKSWAAGAENNAFLVETVTGMQTVKALALEPQFNYRWEMLVAKYIRTSFNNATLGIGLNSAGTAIQSIVSFAILFWGGHKVMDGQMTIGQLVAFQMLAGQVGAPISRLSGMWQLFQQTALSVERLGDILNTAPEMFQRKGDIPAQLNGAITFERVAFRYSPDAPLVLNETTLAIEAGMKIGIVGRSGSGKSTITKLMQRLYLAEAGTIRLDGIDMAEIDPLWLRRQIGVVLQENFLFNGSVRENIALARPSASIEEVIQVARLAGAHEFILELAEGYDTMVGERGSSLSGGQQQRIAIARALLNNPRIIIFDEATSALDYHSERIILDNMENVAKGRTLIMIAHRLSTVRKCDRIFVVEKGEIAEQGTHDELVDKQGIYYRLQQQQEG